MSKNFDNVSETLLITLYARARDAHNKNSVLNDMKSAEIASQIDYDFSKFNKSWASYYGILARAKTMDNEIRKFIEKNPDCIIVSIGAGLDTRFERIDNGKITWYNLDFPSVIEQRKLFFKENLRVKNIPKSALDPSWAKDIEINEKKLLLISEGVLMYFSEEEVKNFLNILTDNFFSFTAYFDLLYKGLVGKEKSHDTVKNMENAQFKWGVKDGSEITNLNPKIRQIGLINFTDELKHILPGWKKFLTPLFYITNNRLGMYTY